MPFSLETDPRDLEIVKAYFRYGTVSRTAREMEKSRDTVRAALRRFRWALERAADCPECPAAKGIIRHRRRERRTGRPRRVEKPGKGA